MKLLDLREICSLNQHMHYSIGIDIGGTNTRVGLVSAEGIVTDLEQFSTVDFSDAGLYADRIAEAIKELISTQGDKTCLGIGIGAPNGNALTGSIESPPNLNFKGNTPLVDLLKARLDIANIQLTNDANAAAVGEKLFGAAKAYTDFVMITLGTGLGSGIFVSDKLVVGANGHAGELGHVTVVPEGRLCGYGRRGSLETYCSATGICRTFFEKRAELDLPTSLDGEKIEDITSKKIAQAAEKGDATAQVTMQATGQMLGKALASFALFTAPQAFFLFGGPVRAGKILLDPVRESFAEHLIPSYGKEIEIIASALPLGDAAIVGAAALVC